MKRIFSIMLFFCFFCSFISFAQSDDFPGTWRSKLSTTSSTLPVGIELQVSNPERVLLYPAQLKIQYGDFIAVYELLLVKKNLRQLGISKNKFPVTEQPFSLGNLMVALNGTFDYTKDIKGEPQLTINRLHAKRYGVDLTEPAQLNRADSNTFRMLSTFLKEAEINLKKINNVPWKIENTDRILSSHMSQTYYGLTDTIHVQSKDGIIHFSGNKKNANDIVSVVLNGATIIDQVEAGKMKTKEDILLDTGLNILTLFAENFNKALPNKAKLNIELDHKKLKLDFTNLPDIAATNIIAKIYYDRDHDDDTHFQMGIIPPDIDKSLLRNEKVIGSIISKSQQIKLALWDDAVEDGDSVSININGKWIARGFPVKKNPQFISVTLEPGSNTITFIADNLGSIPPNTSVLEIIDGKKRKSFTIETNLDQNNLVKIYYEYKPAE